MLNLSLCMQYGGNISSRFSCNSEANAVNYIISSQVSQLVQTCRHRLITDSLRTRYGLVTDSLRTRYKSGVSLSTDIHHNQLHLNNLIGCFMPYFQCSLRNTMIDHFSLSSPSFFSLSPSTLLEYKIIHFLQDCQCLECIVDSYN